MGKSDKKDLPNMHATAIVVGETGILITGASGSGKSRLALEFIQTATAAGRFAALVADDQVFLKVAGQRIIAVAPEAIAGLIEIRGSGIVAVPGLRRAVMHVALAVDDGPDGERLPDPGERLEIAAGPSLPLLHIGPGRLKNPVALLDAFTQNRLLL
ncbi:HPr kinase/phosphorylase [Hoeflea sp. TYP-13]|uniref:HPr kinase/phosphorylase n=1 Tax=Hoeflea sp. TYP-13 TaxID=3230023 RepID=UPI0034C6AF33